jgi:thymidylate synthase ThyX
MTTHTSTLMEIRQYANAVASLIAAIFPRTYELFEAQNDNR